jgi:hypothetical protein
MSHPDTPPATTTTAAFVDSVDSGIARILLPDPAGDWRGYSLPAHLLPTTVKEGSWLHLTVTASPPPADADSLPLRQKLGQADDGKDLSL